MEAQLENWDNFCRHHANNDWYGTWTRYDSDGQIIESFHCIRSFKISPDASEIYHQNHYTYADGKKETKTFGPYHKPITRALFLDNSFSWGSTEIEIGSNFGFETGFRYEDRRASVASLYDSAGSLEKIVVIPETLTNFPEKPNSPLSEKDIPNNWRGTGKTMTPDWIVSPASETSWHRLENIGSDYLILHFFDGISISCPRNIHPGKDLFVSVDWQINSNLLQRGIRNYDASGFTNFKLETFNLAI
ncbi:MAG: DUF3598 family protein [Chlorogloeopsis fritschii C42_A2020_084]|uniref:DUF3598 family protein n=1 Tax=Chlorogloeopsis fritschii TaxID=1124 RepID=UPI0019EA8F22|nr:DUF3598 family protein [Chlorogloeopsis fritschii]MBF2008644.1 DUF3598 family protein [Chlorogloeopsis fritschii C42_A2020_084]